MSEWVSEGVSESVRESVSEWASEWVSERVSKWLCEWVSEWWVSEWVSDEVRESVSQWGSEGVSESVREQPSACSTLISYKATCATPVIHVLWIIHVSATCSIHVIHVYTYTACVILVFHTCVTCVWIASTIFPFNIYLNRITLYETLSYTVYHFYTQCLFYFTAIMVCILLCITMC